MRNLLPASGPARVGAYALLAVLASQVALCATHRGEFWPLSVYPMFSLAGKPWTRALVRQVEPAAETGLWTARDLLHLPGAPFPLEAHGIYQNDLANYLSKGRDWDAARQRGLQAMFAGAVPQGDRLMVYKVSGRIADGGEVAVQATPFALVWQQGLRLAPGLAP